MANRYEKHVSHALVSIMKTNEEIKKRIDKHEKIIDSHAQQICELQQQAKEYRDNAIRSDLYAGISGREVVEKYDLSPGRISQIRHQ